MKQLMCNAFKLPEKMYNYVLKKYCNAYAYLVYEEYKIKSKLVDRRAKQKKVL